MANEKSFLKQYDELPLIARILIQIFAGGIVSGVYRLIKYFDTKNTTTLVVAIIALVTGAGCGILWVIDIITLIAKGGYTVWAD